MESQYDRMQAWMSGPLMAVSNVQAQAVKSTVNIIEKVGFKKPNAMEEADDDTAYRC